MENAEVADLDSARIPVPFNGSGSDLQLWSSCIYVLYCMWINQFLETPYKYDRRQNENTIPAPNISDVPV